MKKLLLHVFMSLMVVGCAGGMGDGCCGWSQKEVTGSGQVKKVAKVTPIVCPDYYVVDISLGVMRNGVGSMSTHDIQLFIQDKDVENLKAIAEVGGIVDFTYDERRSPNCVDGLRLTSFKYQSNAK
jgi:hypothetical protein